MSIYLFKSMFRHKAWNIIEHGGPAFVPKMISQLVSSYHADCAQKIRGRCCRTRVYANAWLLRPIVAHENCLHCFLRVERLLNMEVPVALAWCAPHLHRHHVYDHGRDLVDLVYHRHHAHDHTHEHDRGLVMTSNGQRQRQSRRTQAAWAKPSRLITLKPWAKTRLASVVWFLFVCVQNMELHYIISF